MPNLESRRHPLSSLETQQHQRNSQLLAATPSLGPVVESSVLPLAIDLKGAALPPEQDLALAALEKRAAAIAIRSTASLARAGDIDHLGGGLELIPSLLMTLGVVDYDARHFTIEHGHTSIGYYGALAALGFLDEQRVIDTFRRGLDIAGHVSWVAGGTQLSSGRLGVMMPVGTGFALGLKARKGADALVVCHTGDAGWISGQALNGFGAASLHQAPIVFVMHRNHIQLSGTTEKITQRDPRPLIAALGIKILEIESLHDRPSLFKAYAEANRLAQQGQPSLIYPTGFSSTVAGFGERYGISAEAEAFASKHGVAVSQAVQVPGSLMSFRDVGPMLQCLFYVNGLPGGESHHDGGMKGRDEAAVLANPMMQATPAEAAALDQLRAKPARRVITKARPAKGTANLKLEAADLQKVTLSPVGTPVTARAGSEAAYAALAARYPDRCFFVSCDLDPSTKIGKAAAKVPPSHKFEMSIEEQAASLLANGLAYVDGPQISVFATFSAFFEGIAREGFELWRYQRNLTGHNEGLNVIMHLSHVGACTGRDHFSGWSLDWVNLAIGYLPYLRRFYAPADARAAFLAVQDAAAGYGGHIVAIPRDTLPVLTASNGDALWNAGDAWQPVTAARQNAGARAAVLALGAPAFVAIGAADAATKSGVPTDVYIVNGLPLEDGFLEGIGERYAHVVTVEDGLIGNAAAGVRGFAGIVAAGVGAGAQLDHFGITDPQVAPSEAYLQVWEHFGMTEAAMKDCLIGRR